MLQPSAAWAAKELELPEAIHREKNINSHKQQVTFGLTWVNCQAEGAGEEGEEGVSFLRCHCEDFN